MTTKFYFDIDNSSLLYYNVFVKILFSLLYGDVIMKKNQAKKTYTDNIDIYSSTRSRGRHAKKKAKPTPKKTIIILTSIVAVLAIILGGIYWYLNSLLNNVNRGESYHPDELGVTDAFAGHKVINIALFGIDSRKDNFKGRSDAIFILTIDKEHDKIKLTSLKRDSYVHIDEHDQDKLTHAYAYGGAKLAMKTINENYDMDITDYVTVNFFGITEIIDALGGLTVDVDSDEKYVMNSCYVPELNDIGIDCEYIKKTGLQKLSGAQALAYSRNRYTGGIEGRMERQREILSLMFEEVKKRGVTKLPELVKMGLQNSETSLTNNEITSLATWALTSSPTIESLSLPDEDCNELYGKKAIINYVYYCIYDIDIATQKLHDFIKEEGTYVAPDAAAK